jgi:hypothetical protein
MDAEEMNEGPWPLLLPFRRLPLSGNDRGHTRAKYADQQMVKKAAWAVARHAKVPRLRAALLELIYYPGRNAGPDADNLTPTMKYCIDGLVAAKILPDDGPEYVLGTRQKTVLRRDDPYDQSTPRMVLVITDASALAPPPHFALEELL